MANEMGIAVDTAEVLVGGNQNHVVRIRGPRGDVVLRFARDTTRLTMDPFDVEEWCSGAALAVGIATPKTIFRERLKQHSVIVQDFVPGTPSAAVDLQAWEAIGRVADALREVDTDTAPYGLFSRFGRDLESAWLNHLDYNIDALTDDDPLLHLGVYELGEQDALMQVLLRIRRRPLQQGLSHGDLSTRNLITTDTAGYVVLDWGSAITGPVPWTDLERIYRWHVTGDPETQVSEDAWHAVLSGAGLNPATAGALIDELEILHVLDVVRWSLDQKPDRLPEFAQQARKSIRRILAPERDSTVG